MSFAPALAWGLAGAAAGGLHARSLWTQASGRARAGAGASRVLAVVALFTVAIRAHAFVAPIGWALGLLATATRLLCARRGAP